MALKNMKVREGTPFALKIVEKKVPFNEADRQVMYLLKPVKQSVIEFDDIAHHAIRLMGINEHMTKAMTAMMSDAITRWITTGHAVNIANVGTLKPVVNCKAQTDPALCTVDDLYKLKLQFYPCKEMTDALHTVAFRVKNRKEMVERFQAKRKK